MYLEPTPIEDVPAAKLAGELLHYSGSPAVERFCDDDGGYKRRYNVYKLTADGSAYVLKKSDSKEVMLYRGFLQGKGFAVPEYFGSVECEGALWLLMEHIDGPDLRRFDREMALASAQTLSQIQNAYWNSPIEDGRFQRYWERINRRAGCLRDYPELAKAYDIFLSRQRDCPRTLCSGDFLQCNGILRKGRVYMIDWAFGGLMPYALDIARLIAHGSVKPEPNAFPFYMDADLRSAFVRAHYEHLECKPDWEQYVQDIKLAVLNECVEFLEVLVNDPETTREEIEADFYYRRAVETAKAIM